MDIADHQSSCVAPSGVWTKYKSLPYPTIVPLDRALSKVGWSAAFAFCMSAHCARGMFQFPIYEYIGGFSLTSAVCARPGVAQTTAIASAHSPTETLSKFRFINFLL